MPKVLTTKTVENARPTGVRREIPDGRTLGLYLVVQPSGAKSWAVRYRHGRETRKLTLDRYPKLGLAAAREAANTALLAVAIGGDPAKEKKERRLGITQSGGQDEFVPAIIELYLARHVRGHRSYAETERVLRREVARALVRNVYPRHHAADCYRSA